MARVLVSNPKLVLETLKTKPQKLLAQELYPNLKDQKRLTELATIDRFLKHLLQISKRQSCHL